MNVRKLGASLILTLVMVAGYSQNTINSYKYVVLPQKFDFLSSPDEYGLNTTAKTLLEQKGFTVFWAGANLPESIATNRCSALTADITQRKALFTTNLTLTLKDCYGNTIFKGKEGRSWEKEFGVAFNEALNNAFTSLKALPYKYDSTRQVQTAAQPQQAAAPVQQAATPAAAPAITNPTPAGGTLYAQPIANGYQLVDATPKKIMTLLKTSLQDCFLATTTDAASGIVFKNNDQWFFEYYKDGTLVSQKLTIKF